ncbi:hypothetical protein [Streptomyces prasinus]|uniref:Uncharacterized protein n=1 Tax=Streptomyces prasinus TaxID=67345 RepID=A0ABX6AQL5_9ACTN|nr:hypothetical protein [Streptomyces prasinus]QEV05015.1 hypothetical protein CP972_04385 [Streptomyces prasinus]
MPKKTQPRRQWKQRFLDELVLTAPVEVRGKVGTAMHLCGSDGAVRLCRQGRDGLRPEAAETAVAIGSVERFEAFPDECLIEPAQRGRPVRPRGEGVGRAHLVVDEPAEEFRG